MMSIGAPPVGYVQIAMPRHVAQMIVGTLERSDFKDWIATRSYASAAFYMANSDDVAPGLLPLLREALS